MKQVFKKGFFYLVAFSIVLGNSVLSIDFSVPVAHATQEENSKVTICHATGSQSNPWVRTNVSANAVGSHLEHGADVILEDDENVLSCPEVGPYCGDGNTDLNLETPEECDAGPNGSESCTSECTLIVEEEGECSLEITKTDNDATPAPGEDLVYTLTVTNTGDADCVNVFVKDHFDEDTSYVSADPELNKEPSDYLEWFFASIPVGENEEISLTMNVGDVECDSTLENSAKYTYYKKGGWENDNVWSEFITEETTVVCEEEPEYATVIAQKIVCENETDLPNWSGGANIDVNTAQNFVDENENCEFVPDWKFEWGVNDSLLALDGDYTGEYNVDGWSDFDTLTDANGKAELELNLNEVPEKVWFREVLPEGYLPFSFPPGDNPGSDVSAEFWCNNDVLNYDNAEWINVSPDSTYYCVAFNVDNRPKSECGNYEQEGDEQCDDGPSGSDACTVDCKIIEEECSLENNILVNSSFEEPEVTNSSLWQKFSNVLGWMIEKVSDNSSTTLELHKGWSGNSAAEGLQYSELDGDHSTRIKQAATTELGATYKLFWSFAGRHNITAEQNQLSVEINGSQVATNGPTTASAPLAEGDWVDSAYEFVADSTSTEVTFEDLGPSNSFGTYVDDIRLCKVADPKSECGNYDQEPGEDCDDGPSGSAFCTNECVLIEQPPICYQEGDSFFASSVVSDDQGLRKDGSAVDANRSIPEQGLALELGQNVSNFFSLGFGGEIVVNFDDIFVDGPYNDIRITEDTWGLPYPLEKADVYVSQDGSTWVFLGSADNTNLSVIHTTSEFDLLPTGLTWAKYIKVVDTSDASLHSATGDGYDLNAVEALSPGYIGECKEDPIYYDVHGYKWNDLDGNGERGEESLLSGWIINLYESESSTPLMTMATSDSDDEHFGWYWFEGLPAGDYRICEELKEGWQQTYPSEDGCHWISLPNDNLQTENAVLAPEYNFGNQQLAEEKTYCGDGIVQSLNDDEEVEQCDDGAESSTCSLQCEIIPEPPCTVNCGGGGGGGTSFAIRDLKPAVSCEAFNISWRTTKVSDTILDFGTESGVYTQNINNDTNTTNHSLVFADLLPNTTYYYRIKAVNGSRELTTIEKSFTTPPAEQCGEVLGEKITAEPLVCDFLRASGSTGIDSDVNGVFEYPNGTLLRDYCDRGEAVYLIKDQMKWHVPNWQYLHNNHFGQRIYNVLTSVINGYPNWTAKVLGVKEYADGTLLRGPNMKIYILEEGHKRHISTFAELSKYAGQEIINVSQEVINRY